MCVSVIIRASQQITTFGSFHIYYWHFNVIANVPSYRMASVLFKMTSNGIAYIIANIF